ncbi:MAG: cytochrome c-type biogenesis protein CcmH [Betaproteobacteria bacterium]|jgi:cytochrome c-type biogenesis protein CcmH|nr:cytochrome c-type biogenesis protein CcmH [Rubrivivax sp.]
MTSRFLMSAWKVDWKLSFLGSGRRRLAAWALCAAWAGLTAGPAASQPDRPAATSLPANALTTAPSKAPTASPAALPGVAQPASPDPVLEARVMKLSAELRCLVCQNQTIADSNAGLAVDLRNQVRDMLKRGDTPEQITDYMTARYGDFVLYRPPVKSSTAVLWYGPAALLVLAVVVLLFIVRRRSKLPSERFEPDPEGP